MIDLVTLFKMVESKFRSGKWRGTPDITHRDVNHLPPIECEPSMSGEEKYWKKKRWKQLDGEKKPWSCRMPK